MAVKKYKPVTPGQRGMTGYTFEEITKSEPERSLIVSLRRHGGRNAYGRVTVRHQGGGDRRYVRHCGFQTRKAWHSGQGCRDRIRSRTALPAWRCCFMLMAKNATSLPLWA